MNKIAKYFSRLNDNMNQEEIGKEIGIKGPNISEYIYEKKIPAPETIMKAIQAFGGNLDDLLDEWEKLQMEKKKQEIKSKRASLKLLLSIVLTLFVNTYFLIQPANTVFMLLPRDIMLTWIFWHNYCIYIIINTSCDNSAKRYDNYVFAMVTHR